MSLFSSNQFQRIASRVQHFITSLQEFILTFCLQQDASKQNITQDNYTFILIK